MRHLWMDTVAYDTANLVRKKPHKAHELNEMPVVRLVRPSPELMAWSRKISVMHLIAADVYLHATCKAETKVKIGEQADPRINARSIV